MQAEGRWRRVVRWTDLIVDGAAKLMFLAIFATIVAQTFMRYVLRSPLTTSQELATLAFVWLIFWTAACCLSVKDHIRLDLVYEMFSDRFKRLAMILCNLIFLAIFIYAARDMLDYFRFLERQYTASLRLTYQIAFFPFFLFYVLFPLKLALNVLGLLGAGWKSRI